MPQIRLERVSKYYPQDKKQMAAVQEINLTVEQGEFLFLTGSSGAGKKYAAPAHIRGSSPYLRGRLSG
mgnify:CR=1 FL=1